LWAQKHYQEIRKPEKRDAKFLIQVFRTNFGIYLTLSDRPPSFTKKAGDEMFPCQADDLCKQAVAQTHLALRRGCGFERLRKSAVANGKDRARRAAIRGRMICRA
jgi:hypothetical protein